MRLAKSAAIYPKPQRPEGPAFHSLSVRVAVSSAILAACAPVDRRVLRGGGFSTHVGVGILLTQRIWGDSGILSINAAFHHAPRTGCDAAGTGQALIKLWE
jgi:hypothetical protein